MDDWYRLDANPVLGRALPGVVFYVCPHPKEDFGLLLAVRGDEDYILPRQLGILLRDCGAGLATDSLMSWTPVLALMAIAHSRLCFRRELRGPKREADSIRAAAIRHGEEPLIPEVAIRRAWLTDGPYDTIDYWDSGESLFVDCEVAGRQQTIRLPVRGRRFGDGAAVYVLPYEIPGVLDIRWERLPYRVHPVGEMAILLFWMTLEFVLYAGALALAGLLARRRRYVPARRLILPDDFRGRNPGRVAGRLFGPAAWWRPAEGRRFWLRKSK